VKTAEQNVTRHARNNENAAAQTSRGFQNEGMER
jgi:hypothetical protein